MHGKGRDRLGLRKPGVSRYVLEHLDELISGQPDISHSLRSPAQVRIVFPCSFGTYSLYGCPATSAKGVPVATHNCGKGQHWVPAGYAKHGKYRAGHCAPS